MSFRHMPEASRAEFSPVSHSRRTFLATSAATVSGFWAGISQAALTKAPSGNARSVIMIFNCGGPSHIDLFDPKPEAPDRIRSLFQPISTSIPGVYFTEMVPEVAKRAHKLAIVRSVHHKHSSHNGGMHWSIVGKPYAKDSTLINPSGTDIPSFGTLVGWLAQRDGYSGAVPPYVITPYPHCDSTVYITPGQYGGCLGVKYDPFVLDADPSDKNFQVRNLRLSEDLSSQRLSSRLDLLSQLGSRQTPVANDSASQIDVQRQQAASMVMTGDAAKAFDLSQEPDSIRDKYGRHQWGQSHLLARRLIESGVKFVSTVNGRSIVWDTHNDNFDRLKKRLVPPMEKAYVALLDDLEERGLLDSTLVIWMGDFGRTPIINKEGGRDHWPQCYTMILAGGGIRGGQVVGSSDKTGAHPATRPVTPADIHATVFAALGYDPHGITYQTVDGRPMLLSDGEVISELLS